MADSTINGLTEKDPPSPDDFLAVWDTTSSSTKKTNVYQMTLEADRYSDGTIVYPWAATPQNAAYNTTSDQIASITCSYDSVTYTATLQYNGNDQVNTVSVTASNTSSTYTQTITYNTTADQVTAVGAWVKS